MNYPFSSQGPFDCCFRVGKWSGSRENNPFSMDPGCKTMFDWHRKNTGRIYVFSRCIVIFTYKQEIHFLWGGGQRIRVGESQFFLDLFSWSSPVFIVIFFDYANRSRDFFVSHSSASSISSPDFLFLDLRFFYRCGWFLHHIDRFLLHIDRFLHRLVRSGS